MNIYTSKTLRNCKVKAMNRKKQENVAFITYTFSEKGMFQS